MLCASESWSTFSLHADPRALTALDAAGCSSATTTSDTLQHRLRVEQVSYRDVLLCLTWHGRDGFSIIWVAFWQQGRATQCLQGPQVPPPRSGAQSWMGQVGAAPSGGSEGRTEGSRELRSSQHRESFYVLMTEPGQNVWCEGLFFCMRKISSHQSHVNS